MGQGQALEADLWNPPNSPVGKEAQVEEVRLLAQSHGLRRGSPGWPGTDTEGSAHVAFKPLSESPVSRQKAEAPLVVGESQP